MSDINVQHVYSINMNINSKFDAQLLQSSLMIVVLNKGNVRLQLLVTFKVCAKADWHIKKVKIWHWTLPGAAAV